MTSSTPVKCSFAHRPSWFWSNRCFSAPRTPICEKLRANRRAHIEVGAESFDVTAHELSAGEREQMLPKVTAAVPAFAESQAKTKRLIPLFELQRV